MSSATHLLRVGHWSVCSAGVLTGVARVSVAWQRLFGGRAGLAPYLLTANFSGHAAHITGYYPQCRAVMDDFGNLVSVGAWE